MEMTEQDVNQAKDDVITSLTNELLRARAEVAVLRRTLAEGGTDGNGNNGPTEDDGSTG